MGMVATHTALYVCGTTLKVVTINLKKKMDLGIKDDFN